jgi:hypothetical protein
MSLSSFLYVTPPCNNRSLHTKSRHPQHRDLKNQAISQHCDDRLTLSFPHHISFPIQRGIVFVMASRQFTVDLAKKKEFINILLLMPESSVLNAMKKAKFTEEDIADLRMRPFLQRALPGGSTKGLKAYIAGLLPPPPDHRQRKLPTTAASPKNEFADRHQRKRKPPPISPLTLLLRPLHQKRSPSSIPVKWYCRHYPRRALLQPNTR